MTQRLVVMGGGAAGMSAASAARRVDQACGIVVLEATGHAATPYAPVYEPLLLAAQAAASSVARVAV